MLKEPVVALMGAGFLKQGFVNVMANRAFQDSTTRGFDSRLASFQQVSLLRDSSFDNENANLSNGRIFKGCISSDAAAFEKGRLFEFLRPWRESADMVQ